MNYEYYKIFYYVGKHKNITKAATEMYSSQPAVTRVIQNLENELGCKLFTRNKSGVEFTHEGETLYEYVKIAFNQLVKGEDEVKRASDVETGTVYVGASVTALHEFLFDFIKLFRQKHPKVKLKINTGSNNGTIERLRDGMLDIAFVSTPFNLVKPLKIEKVREFRDMLIAGNSYEELKERVLGLEDIANYPFVSLRHNMQLRQFIDDVFTRNDITVTPDSEADGADLLVPMIGNNLGLGFVPESIASPAIERGEVFEVPLKYTMPRRCIYMVTDPRHPHSNASRELCRMVREDVSIPSGGVAT